MQVDIQAVTVESHLLGRMYPGTREELIIFMNSVGYEHIKDAFTESNATRDKWGTTDDLFIRKDLLQESVTFKDEL